MSTDGPNLSISLTTEESNELMIAVIYTMTTQGSFLYLILAYTCVTKWFISGLRFTPFYSNYSEKKNEPFQFIYNLQRYYISTSRSIIDKFGCKVNSVVSKMLDMGV